MRQYIAATDTSYNTIESHLNAPLFKKVFGCTSSANATLEISAAGFYRIFLNRKEITKGYFAPYISNPDHIIYYDEYQLDGMLKDGDNEILVLLGNGFNNVNDKGIWKFSESAFRSAPKFYMSLYIDGKEVMTTDESFEVYDSPITFDDLRCGEWYDARLEKNMFERARKPVLVSTPKGDYKKCTAQPILKQKEIPVHQIIKDDEGWLYDFGENNTGLCCLKIDAAEGQEIGMVFSELRNGNKSDMRNITFGERSPQGYVQRDQYICKEGKQEYVPSFTYHGFRYVYVTGITEEQATKDLLTYWVIHSDIPSKGYFVTDHEVINKLQNCILTSDTSNFHYFPTDCPHREKNGWTGDVAVSAEQYLYNFDCYASLREWLNNVRKTQLESGEVSCIAPTSGWGYAWGNGMAWDAVLVELPYQLYRFYGKQEIVIENVDAIWKYIAYMKQKENEDGLMNYGLGDWCEAGSFKVSGESTPVEVVASLIAIDFLRKAAFLFEVAKQSERAQEAERYGKCIENAFRKKYISDCMVSCASQTAQAMALGLRLFNEDEREKAYRYLLDFIARDNNHFRVGIFGEKYLFDVLSDFGDTDLAIQLIAQPTFPSFGYMLSWGTNTLWEMFREYEVCDGKLMRKDGTDTYNAIPSWNHHFWGSVSTWFFRKLAGIQVVSAKEILISPCVDCCLNYVEGKYENEYGSICVKWEKTSNGIQVRIDNQGFVGRVSMMDVELPLKDEVKEMFFTL